LGTLKVDFTADEEVLVSGGGCDAEVFFCGGCGAEGFFFSFSSLGDSYRNKKKNKKKKKEENF
jgi:hypothetical protein